MLKFNTQLYVCNSLNKNYNQHTYTCLYHIYFMSISHNHTNIWKYKYRYWCKIWLLNINTSIKKFKIWTKSSVGIHIECILSTTLILTQKYKTHEKIQIRLLDMPVPTYPVFRMICLLHLQKYMYQIDITTSMSPPININVISGYKHLCFNL